MAVQKKQPTQKTKKEIVKKKMSHKVVVPEIQQATISESVGGAVVIPSPQSEPELPKVETQQVADTLASQPESATNNTQTTENITNQDPFAVNGVVRDKPEQYIEQPKKKRSWIVIVLIIVGIVFIGGALWYFRENVMKRAPVKDEMTPAPSVLKNTPTPASDSAKLAIDYSKYKIKVLNGSGIGGTAAKGKEILESEKFIVEEIGNADNVTYEKTVIQAKKQVPNAFLDKLKSVLEETYLLDANEELEDSEEVDVVIIIGSGKQP